MLSDKDKSPDRTHLAPNYRILLQTFFVIAIGSVNLVRTMECLTQVFRTGKVLKKLSNPNTTDRPWEPVFVDSARLVCFISFYTSAV